MTETVTHTDRPPLHRPRGARRRAAHSLPSPEPLPDLFAGHDLSALPTITPPHGTGPVLERLTPDTGSMRLGKGRADGAVDQRLRVDWPQCKAHGLCAEIAPEVIQLDEWGYPLFDPGTLSPEDLVLARKAIQVCPTLALRLVEPPGERYRP
ncbi:MAG: ferredoxin [Actinomycetota bacterium]|nr:ferredoxin [Actinomycetota bacterium]